MVISVANIHVHMYTYMVNMVNIHNMQGLEFKKLSWPSIYVTGFGKTRLNAKYKKIELATPGESTSP